MRGKRKTTRCRDGTYVKHISLSSSKKNHIFRIRGKSLIFRGAISRPDSILTIAFSERKKSICFELFFSDTNSIFSRNSGHFY